MEQYQTSAGFEMGQSQAEQEAQLLLGDRVTRKHAKDC